MSFPKTQHAQQLQYELEDQLDRLRNHALIASGNDHGYGSAEIYNQRADELEANMNEMFGPDAEDWKAFAAIQEDAWKAEFAKFDMSKLEFVGEVRGFRTYHDAEGRQYWTTRPNGDFDAHSFDNPLL